MDFSATEWPDLAEKVVLYVTVWTKLCNHAAESLNWHKCNEEPSHRHFPLPKNHLHHNHCLHSTGLPPIKSTTHPPHTFLDFWPCWCQLPPWQRSNSNSIQPKSDIGKWSSSGWSSWLPLPPLLSSPPFFSIFGLKKILICCCFKGSTLLYGLIWEPLMKREKIITENWCLGDALEPLITSGTAEVTEKCCEVSSWPSVHEKCCRSLSKNKCLSKNRYPPKFKTHQ